MEKNHSIMFKTGFTINERNYSCKKSFKTKHHLDDDIISGGRVYIEDMVNICNHYY